LGGINENDSPPKGLSQAVMAVTVLLGKYLMALEGGDKSVSGLPYRSVKSVNGLPCEKVIFDEKRSFLTVIR
jgi:hypothetical protein